MKNSNAHLKLDYYRIIHEIGNPLNAMSTTIQLMERHLASETQFRDELMAAWLQDLKSEITRLQRILSEARSRSESHTDLRPMDLSAIIANVVRSQKAELDIRGIRLVEEFSPDLPPVLADSLKLQQALLNLVKNSIEAMPGGGILTLRTSRKENNVVLEIGDTGVGIPKNVAVFSPQTTTKTGGMGLGLPVVRDIVAAHGGDIAYETKEGVGTHFRLSLLAAERRG